MLFLSARGETGISFAEIVSNVPNVRSKVICQLGTKAACLAPKRSLGVMNGEVNVVYQLSLKALVPVRFKVPRKVSPHLDYLLFSFCFFTYYRFLYLFQAIVFFFIFSSFKIIFPFSLSLLSFRLVCSYSIISSVPLRVCAPA
jgi:hypothetical protein